MKCGMPHGSPVSPIIFMLYMEPLLNRREEYRRFTYMDDFALLQMDKSAAETGAAVSEELADTLKWGRQNAVTFAPNKYEIMHFTKERHRTLPNPSQRPVHPIQEHRQVARDVPRPAANVPV